MLLIQQDEVVQLEEGLNETEVNEGSALFFVSDHQDKKVLKAADAAIENLRCGIHVLVAEQRANCHSTVCGQSTCLISQIGL